MTVVGLFSYVTLIESHAKSPDEADLWALKLFFFKKKKKGASSFRVKGCENKSHEALFALGQPGRWWPCKRKTGEMQNSIWIEASRASTYGARRVRSARNMSGISSACVFTSWRQTRKHLTFVFGVECRGRGRTGGVAGERDYPQTFSLRARENGGGGEDVPCVLVNPS